MENGVLNNKQPTTSYPLFIKTWTDKIKQLGLSTPAILLLEAHKPLSFVASQFLLISEPFLNVFLPTQFTNNAVNLFSERSNLNLFIQKLEDQDL